MKKVKPITEEQRKKKSQSQIHKIIAEETQRFVDENRAKILRRAEKRLRKMVEILK